VLIERRVTWNYDSTDFKQRISLETGLRLKGTRVQCLWLNFKWNALYFRPVFNFLYNSRLGAVVVSVLATGPKGCGFEPGRGDRFF
jgi:hypothetical protein